MTKQVLYQHYQRASASRFSKQIEDTIEDQVLSTFAAKKTQESIRRLLRHENDQVTSDEEEEAQFTSDDEEEAQFTSDEEEEAQFTFDDEENTQITDEKKEEVIQYSDDEEVQQISIEDSGIKKKIL